MISSSFVQLDHLQSLNSPFLLMFNHLQALNSSSLSEAETWTIQCEVIYKLGLCKSNLKI